MKSKGYTTSIIIGIVIIIIMIVIYLAGRNNGIKIEQNKNIDKEVKTLVVKEKITQKQIDSLNNILLKNVKEKTVFVEKEAKVIKEIEKITIEKPKDTVCNDLYEKASKKISLLNTQISIKDSVEKRSNNIIGNQSIMLSKKDSIINFKTKQINLIQQKKTVSKKFGIGVNVGYGISVSKDKVEAKPYVGIGVSYNFINF